MKLRASHKDLLLILGIVVAVIISITTWLRDSNSQASQISPPPSPRTTLPQSSDIAKKLATEVLAFAFPDL